MISGIASPDFITTASFQDQSKDYAAQIDELEKRLADVLAEFKRLKTAAQPSVLNPATYEAIESQIQKLVQQLEAAMQEHNVSQDIRSRLAATNAQLRLIESQLSEADEMRRALSEGCIVPRINNAAQRRVEYLAAEADPLVLRAESLRASERSQRMRQELSSGTPAKEKRTEDRKILDQLESELAPLEQKVAEAKASGDQRKIQTAVYNLVRAQAKRDIQRRDMAERDRKGRDGGDGRW
jgi:hypothetical protein